MTAILPSGGRASSADTVSWAFRCRRNTILFMLVGQITLSALLMRYSRTSRRDELGPKYRASVAVFMTEAIKLPICLLFAWFTVGDVCKLAQLLKSELPSWGTLKCAVPAIAYTLQGNLLFVATANLETPTFQVTYQTKTLFTALFSVILLRRRLVVSQWLALLLLFCGTIAVSDLGRGVPGNGKSMDNMSSPPPLHHKGKNVTDPPPHHLRENAALGLTAVVIAALLSSASSVYFEMMLKQEPMHSFRDDSGLHSGGDLSLWVRNIQLGLFALPLAAFCSAYQDGRHIQRVGALAGFDHIVWSVVVVNGLGGLLVAATMKYADNIVKCFATALAIVVGAILSVPIFGFEFSRLFAMGAGRHC